MQKNSVHPFHNVQFGKGKKRGPLQNLGLWSSVGTKEETLTHWTILQHIPNYF